MELRWNSTAKIQFGNLLSHLDREFGTLTSCNVAKIILKAINLLPTNPRIGKRIEPIAKYEIRSLVFQKTSVYYKVMKSRVIILAVVDNRMSPKNIMKVVKSQINNKNSG